MDGMSLAHRYVPGAVVITVAGDVDALAADEFAGYVARVRRRDDEAVVFDLAGSSFIDSAGLRVLTTAYGHARRHGGTVHLAALRPQALRVLDITQMNAYLPVHLTVEDAVRAATAVQADPGA